MQKMDAEILQEEEFNWATLSDEDIDEMVRNLFAHDVEKEKPAVKAPIGTVGLTSKLLKVE